MCATCPVKITSCSCITIVGGLWSPCQCVFYTQSGLPDSTLLTFWPPFTQLMLHISSLSSFFAGSCWGWTAIWSYLCSLNPIFNILILNTQPLQGWKLSFSGVTRRRGGRWAEVTRSKASWGPQPKHTWWHSCCSFFSPLFGADFHLELKTDHSLLFVCSCQVRPSTRERLVSLCA